VLIFTRGKTQRERTKADTQSPRRAATPKKKRR
jgi:hypothetical protein